MLNIITEVAAVTIGAWLTLVTKVHILTGRSIVNFVINECRFMEKRYNILHAANRKKTSWIGKN
jgi:hypothetical protein